MGRKTNPVILRVGNILRTWDAKWFAEVGSGFRVQLLQDLKIRNYINRELRMAAVGKIEISRDPRELVLTLHTSRPAVVIGRGGSGIEKIQKDLKKAVKDVARIRINVQEISNPDTDGASVATQVIDQLERRMPFRRVLKHTVSRVMQAGAKGVKISLAGRLNGSEIARTEWLAEGSVPLHTFRTDISYAEKVAFTTYGTIGVKVWINRGDYKIDEEEVKPGEVTGKPVKKATQPRRKSSLSEKAKATKATRKVAKKPTSKK